MFGAMVAACTVIAAVVGVLANLTALVGFVTGRTLPELVDSTTSAHAAPTAAVVPTSREPRTLVVPPIGDTRITPSPLEPGGAQREVPQAFHGKWFGLVYQNDSSRSPYPVELDIGAGTPGADIASVGYRTLECGGAWNLQTAWDNKIRSTEVLSYGKGSCLDNVTIELSVQPDGQLYYMFDNYRGVGILTRRQ